MGGRRWAAAGAMAAAMFATPTASAPAVATEQALANAVGTAVRDAETMAVNSGQPAQYVVFEISKAVRDVVWSSGEKPALILRALALSKTPALSTQARQAVTMIEQEMAQ